MNFLSSPLIVKEDFTILYCIKNCYFHTQFLLHLLQISTLTFPVLSVQLLGHLLQEDLLEKK